MRELTQNELNVIAGGDRGTYTAWGSAIGGFVGTAVGTGEPHWHRQHFLGWEVWQVTTLAT